MNLVLIGPRGSGKSTVGRLAAERSGREFVDTDALVVAAAGRSIREIFADKGETAFRALESAAVAAAVARDGAVIAVGGGAVLSRDNRRTLRRSGWIVWLDAPAEVLLERIAADPASDESRPPLTDLPSGDEMRRMLRRRRPFYVGLSDLRVATGNASPQAVADQIVEWLSGREKATPPAPP